MFGKFQFPTNGKAHSDYQRCASKMIGRGSVSIPYEREGTFRLNTLQQKKDAEKSFNSLRTGRHIQTRGISRVPLHQRQRVSIPYEREGTFRQVCEAPLGLLCLKVSIPYEREGTFRLSKE